MNRGPKPVQFRDWHINIRHKNCALTNQINPKSKEVDEHDESFCCSLSSISPFTQEL